MISLNDVLLAMSNIPVDDPIAEIWGRGLQGGGYTVIEYTGTLPITINANGQPLLDYRIYGNTEQTGTPTPENPIMPIGCGERTENLFDKDNTEGIEDGYYIDKTTGNKVYDRLYYISAPMAVTSGETYCWIFRITLSGAIHNAPTVGFFDANDNKIGVANHYSGIKNFSFTAPVNCTYIRASVYKDDADEAMLVLGSTAPQTYIPYGYKLSILSNSTVTNIYLGEVETTRRIKKLVLTGTETMYTSGSTAVRTGVLFMVNTYFKGATTGLCNILEWKPKSSYTSSDYNRIVLSNDPSTEPTSSFYLSLDNSLLPEASLNGVKTYLKQQYANGTPVTVWYVLAEPETGIVNEPLMKIGDYADTVDSTQTNVQIPTSAGTTVIDYNGTTKPSQMYIKYLEVKK